MMYVKETKKRSLYKAISWRVVATLNSWIILTLVISDSNLMKAVIMNITGFFVFYIFERIWSRIKYGRHIIQEKNGKEKENT